MERLEWSLLNSLVFIIAAITLFLFALQSFSHEVQQLSQTALRGWLLRLTRNRLLGVIMGAFSTAILQSSSAVSAIIVSLVHARLLPFTGALALLLGANIGTSSTAFIVSFKAQMIGAYCLVLGSLLSALTIRARVVGKSLFFFGLILFGLDQIGLSLGPIKQSPWLTDSFKGIESPLVAFALGAILTALVQSSSVITGLAVLLTQQGLLQLPVAVGIVFGANVGTTTTALLASIALDSTAKMIAKLNLVFNVIGVIFGYPFLRLFVQITETLAENHPGKAVAMSHLIFNLVMAALVLPWIYWIARKTKPEGAL